MALTHGRIRCLVVSSDHGSSRMASNRSSTPISSHSQGRFACKASESSMHINVNKNLRCNLQNTWQLNLEAVWQALAHSQWILSLSTRTCLSCHTSRTMLCKLPMAWSCPWELLQLNLAAASAAYSHIQINCHWQCHWQCHVMLAGLFRSRVQALLRQAIRQHLQRLVPWLWQSWKNL